MNSAVRTWLEGLGLAHLGGLFEEHEIAFGDLALLSDEDLREIGVALGPRRRILNALADLGTEGEAETGERRQITVMFADLAGSTQLAASLDPEDMDAAILAFQTACSEVMAAHGGYIAEYLGDGALIYFGWPAAGEDAAARAGRAALALAALIPTLTPVEGVTLQVRIGITTGLVVVKERPGPGDRRHIFITGQPPNVAARLQGIAEPGTAVCTAITARLAGQALETRPLGLRSLKGVPEPVEVHQLIAAPERFGRRLSHSAAAPRHMIGGEKALAALRGAWTAATAGTSSAVLLAGEAGIGKSRTVAALIEEIGPGARVLSLQCSPIRQGTALWPLLGALGGEAGFATGDAQAARLAKLEAYLDGLAPDPALAAALVARAMGMTGLPVPWHQNWSAERERRELLAMLAGAIDRMAAGEPLLLLVEDAHWIDPTTGAFLQHLASTAAHRRAAILVTSRSDAELELADAATIALPRLTDRQVSDLIDQSGGHDLPPAKKAEIVRRADGVPLFVEELTRAVLETGEGNVPETLKDTLMPRLDRDPEAKQVAQIAAGLGRVFSVPVVGRALGWPNTVVDRALAKLAAVGVAYRDDEDGARYAFKHALVRDIAYESILKSERAQLHERLLDALTAESPEAADEQPEVMALHAAAAGLADQAATWWRRAAELAMQRSAHIEALDHYRNALAELLKAPDEDARARAELDLQLAIGVAAIHPKGHGSTEVRDAFTRADELSQRVGDAALRFRALRGLWHWYSSVNADFEGAARGAADLVTFAESSTDTTHRLMAYRIMGYTQLTLGRYNAGKSYFETALSYYDPDQQAHYVATHGEDPGLWCYSYHAWTNDWLGERDQALAWKDEAVALAGRLPNNYSKCFTLGLAAQLHRWRREPEQARDHARQAIAIANKHGVSQFHAWSDVICGWAQAAMGDLDGGLEQAEAGLALWRTLGLFHVQWRHLLLLAEIHRLRGEPDRALKRLDEAVSYLKPDNLGLGVAELQIVRGETLEELGRWKEAEATLRAAHDLSIEQRALTFALRAALSLAQALSTKGRQEDAGALLDPVLRRCREGRETADVQTAKALMETIS